jgi:hypothetical protein
VDVRDYTLDQVHIPRMYFQEQSVSFMNKKSYLAEEFKRLSSNASHDDENENLNAGPSPKTTATTTTTLKRVVDNATREPSKRLKNTS